MKKFIGIIILAIVITYPHLTVFAQTPDTQPIIILPNKEVMPSSLPFDIRSLKTPGEPTTPPKSQSEREWLEKEAILTFDRIKILDKIWTDVDNKGKALAKEIEVHNNIYPGGCIYPADNPRFCDSWIAEANSLNDKKMRLLTEWKYLQSVRKDLVSHLSIIQARLKLK